MARKKKLRIDRVILVFIIIILMCLGMYKGTRLVIEIISSMFSNSDFVEEVNGPIIGTVILDAGHGENDIGCSNDDIYEKDINLRYVKEIGNYLMKHGVKVEYTRKDDTRLANEQNADLKARCLLGEKYNADYFISIHVNAQESKKDISGFEVYYKNQDEQSYNLANNVSNAMEELNYSKNRGIIEGKSLYVIRNNTVTPILVELGYIKSEDLDYLTSDYKTKKLSQNIAEGIIKTLNEKEQ